MHILFKLKANSLKAILPTLLTLIILTAAPGGALADDGSVTLETLRQTAPARVTFTIDGTVYDVPVILPQADTLPILLCRSAVFNTADLRERYPMEGNPSNMTRIADAYWNHADSTLISYDAGQATLLFGTTDSSTRASLPIGAAPPENDLTTNDLLNLIYARIAEFQGDTSADLRVYRAVAMSGLYHTKSERFTATDGSGVSYRMQVIDETKPVSGKSKGIWNMEFTQYLHNIPIFPNCYSITHELTPENEYRPNPICINGRFLDETTLAIGVGYVREREMLSPDTALAPFSAVAAAIEERIQSGQLKNIFQLSLGYTVFLPDDSDLDAIRDHSPEVDYLLLPTWQICGYDLKDEYYRYYQGNTVPDEQTVMQNLDGKFELRLDAVTAEPIEHLLVDLSAYTQ